MAMGDSIDLSGVVEQLQNENERLRMILLRSHSTRFVGDVVVSVSSVQRYIFEHAETIAALLLIAIVFAVVVVTIVRLVYPTIVLAED